MDEGYDMAQLSAGDTVVLTQAKTKKCEASAALHALCVIAITEEAEEKGNLFAPAGC